MRGSLFLRKVFSALVAVTTMLSMVSVPLPASAEIKPAPATGTVSGIVKDPYGVPITGNYDADYVIMIEAWQWDGASWNQVYADGLGNDFQVNYADGTFLFDLPVGTYKLRFYDWFNTWSNEGYRPEFYPNSYTVTGAANVVVTSGGTTTANMTLAMWEHGTAAGTVTNAVTSANVEGIQVVAYGQDGFGNWTYDYTFGYANSLSMGDWTMERVPVGQYKIEFSDPEQYRYASAWYGGGTDIDSAGTVTIAPMYTTSGLDVELDPLGQIKGRVTYGGVGVKGVSPLALVPDGVGGWTEYGEGSHQKPTDANGYYSYIGLPAGTYRMAFTDYQGRYLTKAWGGVDVPSGTVYNAAVSGTSIVVGAGSVVTGKNVALTLGARFQGTVEDVAGNPVIWADVTALDSATGDSKGQVQTDEDGYYVLGNLAAGTYKVRFDYVGSNYDTLYYPYTDTGYYYDRQFYSGKSTLGAANAITLATGTYGTAVNATLAATTNWGTIDARVTGPNGSELSGISVYLDYSDGGSGWSEYYSAQTDYRGRVSFPYVPAGTVTRLRVNKYIAGTESWADKDGWSMWETTYTMVGGATKLHNAPLTKAAKDVNGNPLGILYGKARDAVTSGDIAAVPVIAYVEDTFSGEWWWAYDTIADSTGLFEIPAMAGDYIVEAGPTMDYASEFYLNAATMATAIPRTVTPPSNTGPIVMPLDRAHTFSGTITDASGNPIEGAYVEALKWNPDWDVWGGVDYGGASSAFTASDGTYTLGGLANGTYRLVAYGWDSELGTKAWKTGGGVAQSVDQGSDIVLAGAAAAHGGYDMTLTPGAQLTGSVADGDAKRVTGVHVKLWWDDPAGDWALINSTYTYHDGDFSFGMFSAGDYFLEFIDDTNYLYQDSWYDSVAVSTSADPVTFADGEKKSITQTVVSVDTTYSPVFGATRLETAVKASQAAFPDGATTVVIATGFNWPDALGGAALAGAYDGPILLTNKTYLPYQVTDEIERLGATDAIILGSTAAVGAPVESALKSALGAAHVSRLQGGDRYSTAVAIAEATIDRLGAAYDGMAFVSTGENFPDALGASPLAAASNWPIYLTDKEVFTTVTRTSMSTHGVTDALILGSTAAVSTAVEASLDTLFGGSDHTTRLQGDNRYETAAVIAQWGVDNVYGLGWNNLAIATGENYPDALAGGVLQGQSGSVMLLTPMASLHAAVAAKLTAEKDTITEVRYLGSTNAVSTAVRTSVQALLK
jgi:putative cell wall-binding protein